MSRLFPITMQSIQLREEHWVIADLVGKGGHIRTVPIPVWVKKAVDAWTEEAQISEGVNYGAIKPNYMRDESTWICEKFHRLFHEIVPPLPQMQLLSGSM
jgi:hypothetical protein